MTEVLNKILEFEKQLADVNTDDVEPTIQTVKLENVMRDDVVEDSLPIKEVFLNAPRRSRRIF